VSIPPSDPHAVPQLLGRLTPPQVDGVTSAVEEAADVDGVPPLSEHVLLHLRYGGDESTRNLVMWDGDELAGYLHLDLTDPVDGPSAELVVRPSMRRRGYGRALITSALAQSGGRLRLWAHGGLPEAAAMASQLGFTKNRELWQLRRSLLAPLPKVELPTGVTLRAFVPGDDDKEWLAVNALAFAGYPDQGGWTLDDLHLRLHEDWFDPAGFLVADRAGAMVGFDWTKVHGGAHTHHAEADGAQQDQHGHEPIGEIYVIGVHPAAQGLGLGRQLTVAGLLHLRSRGLHQVMLYVDESNTPAIHLYDSLGFSKWDVDVMFRYG
jgi:mycothiol synthase